MKTYSELLHDPRWQKKRLKVLDRDGFECTICGEAPADGLNVHHSYYIKGRDPWKYPMESLWTVCNNCHGEASNTNLAMRVIVGRLSYYDQCEVCCMLKDYRVRELLLMIDWFTKNMGHPGVYFG